jgi:hypothetical protein
MEWFASLYLNSTDRYDDFEWYKVRKKKPKLSYKKKMRDIRKKKRLQKSLERAYKQQKKLY